MKREVYSPLVLCYHAVSASWPCSLAVSPDLLRSHLALLGRRGYAGLTFAEAERRRGEGTLPRRSVVVTFDDAYRSTLLAAPVLREAGFPGTVFVVTRFAESGEPLCWPGIDHWADGPHRDELAPLSWEELAGLRDSGWEVGSHTVTHPVLPDLDDEALGDELTRSRRAIEERLGACETIAYPYGRADARVAAAARAAGYLAGCTLSTLHDADEPHLRPRAGLYPIDRGLRARAKLSPALARLRRSRLLGPALARLAAD